MFSGFRSRLRFKYKENDLEYNHMFKLNNRVYINIPNTLYLRIEHVLVHVPIAMDLDGLRRLCIC
jgi:hypothetical protein